MKNKKLLVALGTLGLGIYLDHEAYYAREKTIKLTSTKIKNEIRLSQISDLHSNPIANLDQMLANIRTFDPHFIILTGDIIDYGTDRKIERSLYVLGKVMTLGKKTFLITGNHEERGPKLDIFLEKCKNLGITYLANSSVEFSINNNIVNLYGLKNFERSYTSYKPSPDKVNIILSHSFRDIRDDRVEDFDFVFSGHTHGGQVRIPLVGALLAPNEGILPKYDMGKYSYGKGQVYIDSGLGNTFLPLRFLDPIGYSNIRLGSVV
ncbi:MAG: metallophosphoesterase [Anaerococcus sp.]|nr:metallophosphoesterase [Anaerococcus sp.]